MEKCSFCGKSQYEVNSVVAGPDVCICEECIILCMEIIMKRCQEISKENNELYKTIHFLETL